MAGSNIFQSVLLVAEDPTAVALVEEDLRMAAVAEGSEPATQKRSVGSCSAISESELADGERPESVSRLIASIRSRWC